jgi:hypothetical protein
LQRAIEIDPAEFGARMGLATRCLEDPPRPTWPSTAASGRTRDTDPRTTLIAAEVERTLADR